MENVVNDSGYQAKKIKDDRGPNISSEVLSMNSEKLNLSRKQFFQTQKEDPGCTWANPYLLWSHKKVTTKQQTIARWFVDNINIHRIKT